MGRHRDVFPRAYAREASLGGKLSERGASTLRAIGRGSAHAMRWSNETGFEYEPMRLYYQFEVKMRVATELVAKTIETYYPDRLKMDQPPFEVLYDVRDFPATGCVSAKAKLSDPACANMEQWSPVYTFASAPRDGTMFPTLVGATLITLATRVMEAMGRPTTEQREYSRESWTHQNMEFDLFDLAKVAEGERASYAWENLKNVTVWRGADLPFLGGAFPNFKEQVCYHRKQQHHCHLVNELSKYSNKRRKHGVDVLLSRDDITPRLRAVLMSRMDGSWIDAAFYPAISDLGKKLGLYTRHAMSVYEHAHYKYQLDLGGWSGTTWTGTLRKLSMPGVLLHHETSMKDSFYDELEPWKHYIPVKEDLSDLRERYDWALAHDEECRRISEAADAWVRNFISRRAILKHNYDKLAVPLERALEANGVRAHRIAFEDAHPEYRSL